MRLDVSLQLYAGITSTLLLRGVIGDLVSQVRFLSAKAVAQMVRA